ncbi:Molybdenum cofactor sulfurase [Emericellopsis cladophorae]|uniref:Molybdenum cofactor sulfurase n=1 Tax=Emericellopsis cladophorae TaxID=2686198 RepID=A0A9P9XVW0_9HYPO|nr:Molybdenum cofactor sulfurase [Emericellopsis cladophorae]KAI6778568.1 Molybdenum cofactor sulfurase [Emericellopsis cladophorae]
MMDAHAVQRDPDYGMSHITSLRETEYPYLDHRKHTYLDYTGASLPSITQVEAHHARLASTVAGNPHSVSPASGTSTDLVDETRRRILLFLHAAPEEYTVIFTANATAAAKLVGEAYPFDKRTRLVLTADNHNSINGLRQYARQAGADVAYVPIADADSLRISTSEVGQALPKLNTPMRETCSFLRPRRRPRTGLFAYPAQSNFSGVQHPLSWVSLAQSRGYKVLLDAAAYLPTTPLDLSRCKPDFVILSWYKVFGFPTGVGCLIARHDTLTTLERPWFSGGAVDMVTVGREWHRMADGSQAWEDGTLNFLAIPDVHVGLNILVHTVGYDPLRKRLRLLTRWCIDALDSLQHGSGHGVCRIYGPRDVEARGGTIAFNVQDVAGVLVDEYLVARDAAANNISIRAGCFCNPGVGETVSRASKQVLRSFAQEREKDRGGMGAVRISLGIASTVGDVETFVRFIEDTYKDRKLG